MSIDVISNMLLVVYRFLHIYNQKDLRIKDLLFVTSRKYNFQENLFALLFEQWNIYLCGVLCHPVQVMSVSSVDQHSYCYDNGPQWHAGSSPALASLYQAQTTLLDWLSCLCLSKWPELLGKGQAWSKSKFWSLTAV